MRKLFILSMLFIIFGLGHSIAQSVTTAQISGKIDTENGPSAGASVTAVHEPSGTKYQIQSNSEGRFTLSNLRIGGPYFVLVSHVAYQPHKVDNITLSLGQDLYLPIVISGGMQLDEVVVNGAGDNLMNAQRGGTALNISREAMETMPTVSRSINDLTKAIPQSNGTSFGGANSRFNNYTIDGNIYNNNFGVTGGQFAGSNPISLDAIEEVQINLAPFDVRQGGFTGANVNAVTRSGSNRFTGSVYHYLRNDQMTGDKSFEERLNKGDSENKITGFRLGGPIIKDKLFFFVNYEQEDQLAPGNNKRALREGESPDPTRNIIRVPFERAQYVQEKLQELYQYNTGNFENYPFANNSKRFNARLDWNINDKHKMFVRFNDYKQFRNVQSNNNSLSYLPSSVSITGSRNGSEGLNFFNSTYTNNIRVRSITGELSSILSNRISNQFSIGYSSVEDPRRGVPGGQSFPFIDVLEPDADGQLKYYFSVGNELFTVGNVVSNNTFNITNNTHIVLENHFVTAGVNFEYMTFENAFNPMFNGYYRYSSYDDFVRAVIDRDPTVQPYAFAQGYSYGDPTVPPVDATRFAQLSLYGQDEFRPLSNLKLTLGLRADMPFYPISLPQNDRLLQFELTDPRDGSTVIPDVSQLPKAKLVLSPRFGFNYDVFEDRSMQIRGGTGIFLGRIPFVYISNQVNRNGVTRGGYGLTGDDFVADPRPFNPDVDVYRPDPSTLEEQVSNEINLTDKNFSLPKIWRSTLALDKTLPGGFVASVEGIFSMDMKQVTAENLVLPEPHGYFQGADPRPYYTSSTTSNTFSNVYMLRNAEKNGYYYSLTFLLNKRLWRGMTGNVAYTHSRAKDYGFNGGAQAAEIWPRTVRENRNNPELGYSNTHYPHRLMGWLSYKTGNTTVSVFYDAGQGVYSYTYQGNFGDGANRLLYIPNSASELRFEEFAVNDEVYTAQRQAALLDAFIDQDPYLKKRRGQYAERNAAKYPWNHTFDLRIVQDLNIARIKATNHRLQLSLDVLNIGNLFNSNWGGRKTTDFAQLLSYREVNANQEPVYRIRLANGTNEPPTETFRNSVSLSNTWRAQVGIRYIFD
ncbi:TonB-dependent receptor [Sphingobacterium haloxyli]|uniref:Cell envelope biogenesis protein OmpA n=1 Tax=Sphingobacterium haloxyli TaxID=2100533 RepID=A0A2S9J128_9SPHI|nr:TonB-dependent receptor [Sphingobacterium haloxyli]PRD46481.1 cell envelope biogenesis protein OmpA [Sphingobacterium haloxyli]